MIGSDWDQDDATIRYIEAATAPFEAMRTAAAQFAGSLLQRAVDPRNGMGQTAGLSALADLIADAEAQLLEITPRGLLAQHHFRHLSDALRSLQTAHRTALDRLPGQADACERLLNHAIAQLRHATNALPGFALVDLADCCGASHRRELAGQAGAMQARR